MAGLAGKRNARWAGILGGATGDGFGRGAYLEWLAGRRGRFERCRQTTCPAARGEGLALRRRCLEVSFGGCGIGSSNISAADTTSMAMPWMNYFGRIDSREGNVRVRDNRQSDVHSHVSLFFLQ